MSAVGNIYIDAATNKQYKYMANITISPTLITDRPRTYSYSQYLPPSEYDDGEGGGPATTIVLEDEDGNQVVAVLVDEEVDFTATPNDIREGKIAATDDGVTVGEKFIPSYHTSYGVKAVTKGRPLTITNLVDRDLYDYTKLQAVICPFNKNTASSVAAEMVSMDDGVYKVQSTELISTVVKNHDSKSIDFGIVNEFSVPCVIKYITYKEVE